MSSRTSSRKILQSFQARDRLWDAFIAQSEKMECSVDYLINEAMRAYAELNGFAYVEESPITDELPPVEDIEDVDDLLDDIEEVSGLKDIEEVEEIEELEAPGPEESSEIELEDAIEDDDELPPVEDDDLLTEESDSSDGLPLIGKEESNPLKGFTLDDDDDDDLPDLDDDDNLDLGDNLMAPPAPSATAPTIKNSPEIPSAPKAHRPSVPAPPRVVKPAQRSQTGVSGLNPPPVASGTGSGVQAEPARPVLTMIYEGRKVVIQKDQFILGRGTKSADLAIKDSNVSRKHAAIIFHNGAYYIKDLGSTNGVEFGNRLVDSKRIDEGDLFAICGHKFHFTYS
ncbi:MAG: FHA domain-containing protein [Deltaproteobacteria bacterium]|nr:FHA domain-containing protein [Deltaproteobacteria bacterium]